MIGAPQQHGHAIVDLRGEACTISHHHRIAAPPFRALAPYARHCEQLRIGAGEPAARLAALGPFGFGPGGDRDEAAAIDEAVAPEKPVELVGPRIVDRLGLQGLARLALEHQWETPAHLRELALRHHRAGIAGKHLVPEIRAADLVHRIEPCGDFVLVLGHAVEIAHRGIHLRLSVNAARPLFDSHENQ